MLNEVPFFSHLSLDYFLLELLTIVQTNSNYLYLCIAIVQRLQYEVTKEAGFIKNDCFPVPHVKWDFYIAFFSLQNCNFMQVPDVWSRSNLKLLMHSLHISLLYLPGGDSERLQMLHQDPKNSDSFCLFLMLLSSLPTQLAPAFTVVLH